MKLALRLVERCKVWGEEGGFIIEGVWGPGPAITRELIGWMCPLF